MQYAIVDGQKVAAKKGQRGICTGCGQAVIAKCGDLKIHHWAHVDRCICDTWWENETMWHRQWKDQFDIKNREISFFDDKLKEFHRADVFTDSGVTIEFQNSPLNQTELSAREAFYPQLLWVVNGLKFKGFKILKSLPNVNDSRLADYEFRNSAHLSVISKRDALLQTQKPKVHNFYHPDLANIPLTTNLYSFSWKHPHHAWLIAACPVFIDFGGHFLYRLRVRHQISAQFRYLQMFSKQDFVNKYS